MGENKKQNALYAVERSRSAAASMVRNGLMLVACLLPRTRVMSVAELMPRTMTGDPTAARVYVDVHEPCCHKDHTDIQEFDSPVVTLLYKGLDTTGRC